MASDLKTLRESGHMLCEFALEDGSTFALRAAYPSAPKVRQKDAEVFSALRKQSTVFFFDDTIPKPDAVLNWVESRYDQDETQINFFIISPDQTRTGFFGFSDIDTSAGTAEFGRVMKAADAPRGLMVAAIGHGCVWLAENYGIRQINLEVFADNEAAIKLYRKLGFETTGSHYRCKEKTAGHTKWVKCEKDKTARNVLEMRLYLDQWKNSNG